MTTHRCPFARTLLVALIVGALGGCTNDGGQSQQDRHGETLTPASADSAALIPGRWHDFRAPTAALSAEQQATIERLNAIGYVGGSQQPKTEEILTAYDPERAYDGYNFFTSGHAPVAFLADMQGVPLHHWQMAFHQVWPGEKEIHDPQGNRHFWRRAHLFPNGDLLAIFEGLGLIRIDRDSRLLWSQRNNAHHDLSVRPDGDIWVLTREARLIPRVHATEPILEDFISILDANGLEKRRVSVLECFERSEFALLALRRAGRGGDIFHTNSLFVVPKNASLAVPWLQPGQIITSLRTPNVLAVVDLERQLVVQAWIGTFERQHDPTLLPNGHLLLFDNTGLKRGSRVLEIDLQTLEPKWEFRGTPEYPLRSWTCGTANRLANGNVLITDSDQGRAVEITQDGDVVWEFFSPFRFGEEPVKIATLFEMVRLPPEFPLGWLEESSP